MQLTILHASLTTLILAGTVLAGGKECRAAAAGAAAAAVPALASAPAAPVVFGPPLVCHAFEIGDAPSLPWGTKPNSPRADYDRKQLVEDVARLLKTERNLLVRMETLRRAVYYVERDRSLAFQLLGRCALLALDHESAGRQDAEAWFDAGFLAACFQQLDFDVGFRAGVAQGIDGYAYVLAAIETEQRASKSSRAGAMEFAAALMTHPAMHPDGRGDLRERHEAHLARASAAAKSDPLLAQNLASHMRRWGPAVER
jgi:hypothetical protein